MEGVNFCFGVKDWKIGTMEVTGFQLTPIANWLMFRAALQMPLSRMR
jgi:hypothetical protein